MRLDRLDLVRYGRFTDHSLDFGAPEPGRPDLHVVYGPNEAGKSTTLSAFLDLLFGIEARSPYDFLHPYATMRIGAALRLNGVVQTFARIKRPQNSLLDHAEQPVAGAAILAELGGIDREAYRDMFSLDDRKLEEGGESILASKGDLGQLLFSASAGLADLSHGLHGIEAEAQAFYKFKARGGMLPDLKRRLGDLKAEREAIDTLASDYARLIQDRDAFAARYDEAIAERTRIQARIEEIQRLLGALPRLLALRGLAARLAPLADLPEAPGGWAAELPLLQKAGIELDVGRAALDAEIARSRAEVEAITLDEAALGVADRFALLAEARGRCVTADRDLPDHRLRLRDAEGAVAGLLHRLERDEGSDPRRLILGASVAGRLRALIEARSGIDAALEAAAAEQAAGLRRLDEAQAALRDAGDADAAPGGAAVTAALAAALAAARQDDFAARRRLAGRAAEAARLTLAERLRDLHPWRGGADALLALPVPEGDAIAGWTAALAEARKDLDRHAADAERLTSEVLRLDAEREAIGTSAGVVSDRDAAGIRAAREGAWAEHRRRLEAGTADAFEALLRQDDGVTRARFGHMAEVARLHQVSQARAVAAASLDRAAHLAAAAAARLRAVEDEVALRMGAVAPGLADGGLPRFEAWLRRRQEALRGRDLLLAAERDLRHAEEDGTRVQGLLGAALARAGRPAGPDEPVEDLLARAQALIEREAALQGLRAARDERQRDLAPRHHELAQARARERAWAEDWAEACAASWLGEGGAPPIDRVREALPLLADLGPALERRSGLADRVDALERDQAAFAAAIAGLASGLGLDASDHVPVARSDRSSDRDVIDFNERGHDGARDPAPAPRHHALARVIEGRIEAARAGKARREAGTRKLADLAERRGALARDLAVTEGRAGAMTAHFGVATLAEAARRLADLDRRADLRRQAGEAERDILLALRPRRLEEAEAALDAADPAALEAEQAGLRVRFQDLDQRCHELFSTHGKAVDRVAAIGGDARAAEIEERRRTTLIEIEEGARRYLKLRAGTTAAEWALRAYREGHRGSMLETASRAFATISRGAYAGLATQPEKDGETLIAVPAGGGSKHAAELSKGTRFQLYLALRVAGYHEFAKGRRPVPFVADDIMESFDDFRAEETFRLFADMARAGQVIYLTHHRHLCAIARSVCPGVKVHEIGAGPAAAAAKPPP